VRAYWSVFSARFRTLLQYRAAAMAGVATQLFWGLIRMMIFAAFYASSDAPQPMTYPEVVTYVWLGQGMLLLVMFGADPEVGGMIRSGTVAYELARPLDLYRLWYCRALAARTAPTLLRMAPVFLIAGLFFGLQAPASFTCAGLWLLATAAAVLLGAALATVLTISLFWTIAGEGITRLVSGSIFILSGMIVPLPLFPDWLQPVLTFLPFRGMADTPFRIYLGHIPPTDAVWAVAHQLAWAAGLVLVGRVLLARGLRRLVVQGG